MKTDPIKEYKSRFEAGNGKPFPALQAEAMDTFVRLGFPGKHNEEWRYTPIRPIRERVFAAGHDTRSSKQEVQQRFPFLEGAAYAVMENGSWNREASSLPEDAPRMSGISEAKDHPGVQAHFGKYADTHIDPFAAWNTAFADAGLVIEIPDGQRIDTPVYVVLLDQGPGAVAHNRLLVMAGHNAACSIRLITASGTVADQSLLNTTSEVVLGEGAKVEWDVLQMQDENAFQVANTYVFQHGRSVFTSRTVTTGGRIVRNKLHIRAAGEHCESNMYGLYLGSGDQVIDNHTGMFHASPRCLSNQLYKGLVGDRAQAVFNGRIVVERDAQQTNAYQSSKNLLMGPDAAVTAKPQLEIFADDVRCTHGATTGQLDDAALFYLRSRGLPRDEAVSMLNLAFAFDVLESFNEGPFRSFIEETVRARLKEIRI